MYKKVRCIKLQFIFKECNSLISLPDISKWKTEKVTKMKFIYYDCKSLSLSKVIKNKFK